MRYYDPTIWGDRMGRFVAGAGRTEPRPLLDPRVDRRRRLDIGVTGATGG